MIHFMRGSIIRSHHTSSYTMHRLQQRWEEARQHYSVAVKRRPKNPVLHYFIGFVSEKLGSPEDLQVD